MTPLKIALIHNLKPEAKPSHLPPDYYSECDSPKTVKAITNALRKNGHTVFPVEADKRLAHWLAENPVDLAFNISEGFHGEAREARVPALLELLEIPCTGSGVLSLSLALDKAKSKQLFCYAGVPTPHFQLFTRPDEPIDRRFHFPLIVKPNREGSAKGIWASSVVQEEEALRRQVEKVFEMYAQEVLVEEFIEGTELTVGILGKDQLLPVLEIDFSGCSASGESFYSWRMKEFQGDEKLGLNPRFWCPARLDPAVTRAVQKVALRAARAVGCREIARVDIRLSSDGIPYVLEVNPLPGLDPEESNFPIMTQAAGISYEALIQRLVDLALKRSSKRVTQSSIPLSNATVPDLQAPRSRALPDSGGKGLGSPAGPAVAVSERSVRRGAAGGNGSRNGSKEEGLGR
ncbi:MAG: ATP-grasp domain-containing protein [Candidatus Omnitrophica bacterium]|nr:ATP-grasp domain-containing protein [Candidatus Omnitrophota bacterium]